MMKKALLIITALSLFLFPAMGIGGCADSSTSNSSKEESSQAPDDETESSDQSELDGKELVQERCTVCHDLSRIEDAQHDAEGWENTVDRMIGNGAQLNQQERQAVIDYLSDL